jgi:hypothetical protein
MAEQDGLIEPPASQETRIDFMGPSDLDPPF